jgi:hypothetical protein
MSVYLRTLQTRKQIQDMEITDHKTHSKAAAAGSGGLVRKISRS